MVEAITRAIAFSLWAMTRRKRSTAEPHYPVSSKKGSIVKRVCNVKNINHCSLCFVYALQSTIITMSFLTLLDYNKPKLK
jgi:hypothetical protein